MGFITGKYSDPHESRFKEGFMDGEGVVWRRKKYPNLQDNIWEGILCVLLLPTFVLFWGGIVWMIADLVAHQWGVHLPPAHGPGH